MTGLDYFYSIDLTVILHGTGGCASFVPRGRMHVNVNVISHLQIQT